MRLGYWAIGLATLAASTGCATSRVGATRDAAVRGLLFTPDDPAWASPAPAVYRARVETSKGQFVIEVMRDWAPRGADRFYHLAQAGYYDDSRFSRVVAGFIAQFGVSGDSAVNSVWWNRGFPDDSVRASNVRGSIGFAMTGPNARTTQLYINLVDNTRLDAQGFAPIGRIVEGMSVVDSLYSGYGENSGGGVRAGKQGPLRNGGNAYVDREFPKLDRLVKVSIETVR